MKNLVIAISLILATFTTITAQEKENVFHVGSDSVKVYDYESETDGFILVDVFEDRYNLKLTNRLYKIRLSYPQDKAKQVQLLISSIMDGDNPSDGFETMVWKKNKEAKKPMYQVHLEEGKLKIRIYRKQMDEEGYALLTNLGKAFLKEINS